MQGIVSRLHGGLFVCVFALAIVYPVSAADLALKCQAKKLAFAGKYGQCRLKTASKADRRGTLPDFSKCDLSFLNKWVRVESRGTCPSEGDVEGVGRSTVLWADALAAGFTGKECGLSFPQCGGSCGIGQRCSLERSCGGSPCVDDGDCSAPFDSCLPTGCQCAPKHKRVFVTSAVLDGALGGIGGADDTCQLLAGVVGLTGSYYAWLSDSDPSSAPIQRFTQSPIPYGRMDGVLIANDWNDLVDGVLNAPILITEKGLDSFSRVYTNTLEDGTRHSAEQHCGNWTAISAINVNKGTTTELSADWTRLYLETQGIPPLPGCGGQSNGTPDANTTARIYCFEQ